MHTDITAHKQMEEQLRLAQRMEAVGRLAGGIAHDFNNLLMVISGNTQFALEELPEDSPIVADLAEVRSAADRAARLTQQLLAFSREQVLQPQPINLNDVVSNMESLLRRLIGKDVELAITLDSQLAVADADPSQMDQVLMNLAINSRDAMPAGGLLTITTANATISEAEARRYQYPVAPGEYVALVVKDTGCGMSEQTLLSRFSAPRGKQGQDLDWPPCTAS
jgi:signal transduction histidine kinase